MGRQIHGIPNNTIIQTTVNYYETLGRGYLTEVLKNHLRDKNARAEFEFTAITCKHDAEGFINKPNKAGYMVEIPIIVEIKCRRANPVDNKYIASEGLFIEEPKYNYLIALAKERNAIPFYINFFNDGTFAIYDLRKVKPLGIKKDVLIPRADGTYYYENRVLLPVTEEYLRDFMDKETSYKEIMNLKH